MGQTGVGLIAVQKIVKLRSVITRYANWTTVILRESRAVDESNYTSVPTLHGCVTGNVGLTPAMISNFH